MQREKRRYSLGYTLVELLVVMAMMGIAMTIGVSILASTLRSATKTTAFNTVKQNGDVAMELVVRSVQNAVDVCLEGATLKIYGSNVGACPSTITPATEFQCQAGVNNNGTFQKRVNDTGSGGGTGWVSLVTDVKIKSCAFAVSSTTPKRVTIDFTLTQANASDTASDTSVEIPFHSEVTLRNF